MTTLQSAENSECTDLEKTEIAIAQLLGAFPYEWRAKHKSTAFVAPGGAHALMIEDTGTTVRVSHRKIGADGWLSERRAWVLGFKYDGSVGAIEPATARQAEQLTDLIWSYQRLAVEDAVSVRRAAR